MAAPAFFPTRDQKAPNSATLYTIDHNSITNVTGVFVRVDEVLRATANNRERLSPEVPDLHAQNIQTFIEPS